MKAALPPRDQIDRALRLTGLGLAALAAELGLKEATLYKARLGHIPLSAAAAKGLEHLLARRAPSADATVSALRSAQAAQAASADPLAEQLAYLQAHAAPEERALLADVIGGLHRRVASRHARQARKKR